LTQELIFAEQNGSAALNIVGQSKKNDGENCTGAISITHHLRLSDEI